MRFWPRSIGTTGDRLGSDLYGLGLDAASTVAHVYFTQYGVDILDLGQAGVAQFDLNVSAAPFQPGSITRHVLVDITYFVQLRGIVSDTQPVTADITVSNSGNLNFFAGVGGGAFPACVFAPLGPQQFYFTQLESLWCSAAPDSVSPGIALPIPPQTFTFTWINTSPFNYGLSVQGLALCLPLVNDRALTADATQYE